MRTIKALFNLIKRKIGIRSPSQKELDNISKWVIEGLEYYERYGRNENIK